MKRLRSRTTVLGGLAIGLIAGVGAYGATTPPSTTPAPASFTMSVPPAYEPLLKQRRPRPAPCGAGQKLRNGICIIHVIRTRVIPAPAVTSNPASSQSSSGTSAVYHSGGTSSTHVGSGSRVVYTTHPSSGGASGARASGRHSSAPSTRASVPAAHESTGETERHAPEPSGDAAEHDGNSAGHDGNSAGHDD